jgi:hypothetical protein
MSERGKMLGDIGLAYIKKLLQVTDALYPVFQLFQYPDSYRVGDSLQYFKPENIYHDIFKY